LKGFENAGNGDIHIEKKVGIMEVGKLGVEEIVDLFEIFEIYERLST
jgi:hypothetical protein